MAGWVLGEPMRDGARPRVGFAICLGRYLNVVAPSRLTDCVVECWMVQLLPLLVVVLVVAPRMAVKTEVCMTLTLTMMRSSQV